MLISNQSHYPSPWIRLGAFLSACVLLYHTLTLTKLNQEEKAYSKAHKSTLKTFPLGNRTVGNWMRLVPYFFLSLIKWDLLQGDWIQQSIHRHPHSSTRRLLRHWWIGIGWRYWMGLFWIHWSFCPQREKIYRMPYEVLRKWLQLSLVQVLWEHKVSSCAQQSFFSV